MAIINSEIQTSLVPEGTTAFIIKMVEEKVSMSGGKYFRLTLQDLVTRGIFTENVSLGATSAWKVCNLCNSVKLMRPPPGNSS